MPDDDAEAMAQPASLADIQWAVGEVIEETRKRMETEFADHTEQFIQAMRFQLQCHAVDQHTAVAQHTDLLEKVARKLEIEIAAKSDRPNVTPHQHPAVRALGEPNVDAQTTTYARSEDTLRPPVTLGLSQKADNNTGTMSHSTAGLGNALVLESARFDVQRALGYTTEDLRRPQSARTSTFQISKRARESINKEMNAIQRIATSNAYENLWGVVIILNSLCIGLQANSRALSPMEHCEMPWEDVNLAFTILFSLELACRIAVLRLRFFCGASKRWNLFDLVVVTCGVAEEAMHRLIIRGLCTEDATEFGKGITALRTLRVLRIVRIVRAVRVMSYFRELRVMVQSVLSCILPLFWVCMLLLVIQWIFAVYLVHIATDQIEQKVAADGASAMQSQEVRDLAEFYGSLWLALYTLFLSVTGGLDWGEASNALRKVELYHAVILYIFFIALTVFAVLNVVTGVFVENATKLAGQDRDLVIQHNLAQREEYIEDALTVFREADTDHSGLVTWEEFQSHLADPRVQAFFSVLELSGTEARRLFRMLDLDRSGTVSPEEFVTGCMCLKGTAKTLDVAALLMEHKQANQELSASMAQMLQRLEELMPGEAERDSV